jgi:multidrug resistance protein
MGALDIAIIAPAFTKIQSAFHLSMRHLVWIFSIYVLFNLICTPLMARLSDQYGRKKIFIIGISIFAFGSLVVAISWNFPVVIIGRALQGIGSGGIFPIAAAIIGDIFPEERRGRALGFLGAVYGVAFIIGPIVGGLLIMIDWHLIFLVNIFVAAYVILNAKRLLPSKIILPNTFKFDWLGTVFLTAILSGFSWGLNHIDTTHFYSSITSVWIWPFLAGPVILISLFVIIELRATAPIIPVRLFKIPQVTIGQLISFGAGEITSSMVLIPAFAIAAFNVSAFIASLMMIPTVLSISVGALLIGKFVDSYGPKQVVVIGLVLIILSTMALGLTGATSTGFFISTMALAFGIPALIGAPLRYIMLEEAPPQQRSSAQGMTSTVIAIGQLFGSAFLGTVATSHGGGVHGYMMVYIVQGFFTIVFLILALMLKNKKKSATRRISNRRI